MFINMEHHSFEFIWALNNLIRLTTPLAFIIRERDDGSSRVPEISI